MRQLTIKIAGCYACGLAILLGWYVYDTQQQFRLVVLDVGQGSGVYIKTDAGGEIIIDGGQNAQFIRSLSTERAFYDDYIDMVVLSHPDADHMGGFPELIKRYDIGLFVYNGETSDSGLYQEVQHKLTEHQVKQYVTKAGEVLLEEQDTRILVLHPGTHFSKERNDNSVVVRVEYQGYSFLITGDIGKEVEREITKKYKNFVDVDVLVVAHHGSKTSSDYEFVKQASPLYAVISVGKNNRYGHPHRDVLAVYEKLKIPIVRTDESGSISFWVDRELQILTGNSI